MKCADFGVLTQGHRNVAYMLHIAYLDKYVLSYEELMPING